MKRALLLLPWAAVAVWAASLAADISEVQGWAEPGVIAGRVDAVDSAEYHAHPIDLPPDRDAEARVFFFGSSSIAAPSRQAFDASLQAALDDAGRDLQFDNLGWDGLTSWHVRQRLQETFDQADTRGIVPDLVVLYYGHNDVTYTYHYALDKPGFDALFGFSWVLTGEAFREHDAGHTYFFYKHRRVPFVLDVLQRRGLVTLPADAFEPLLPKTLDGYRASTDGIVADLQARGVPLLLATPVGQLAMQPYGPLESATRLWEAAGSADTYDARMALLLAARDAEVWTPDMRAKTPMNDILRQTAAAHDDVSMCDIERAFLDQQLPFDGSMFTDPVHFSAEGRRHLAEGFVACLDEVLPRR